MTAHLDAADELDVSEWAVIRDEPGGRDPNKRWIAPHADAPRHQHWLWKGRQPTGGTSELALTDCAEVVVSRLAVVLGIPAAECRYAVSDGEPGLISRNVAPEGYSLNTGRTYLPEVDGYVRLPDMSAGREPVGRMRRDQGYTVGAVQQVLATVAPPPGIDGLGAFDVFAGYLVLDALVGNGDRHPGNWALLESGVGERFLAPTYDHGSALGAGLTERNRETKDPKIFAANGKANPFAPRKQPLVDLALDAVSRAGQTPWLRRLAAVGEAEVLKALEAPDGCQSSRLDSWLTWYSRTRGDCAMTTLLRTDQLLVSRQDPVTRRFERVGTLAFDGSTYTFEYEPGARWALPGLPLGRVHQAATLFPIFAERVIDPHRPERAQTLERLGLSGDAGPFEVLAVSGGSRTGDTYELTPLPEPGEVSLPFLVHGIRHLTTAERAAIDRLSPGDPLSLRVESDNPVDSRALLVTQRGGRLGYVPGPLLEYVHQIMDGDHALDVERINPAEAGLHMRLLVRLTGFLGA